MRVEEDGGAVGLVSVEDKLVARAGKAVDGVGDGVTDGAGNALASPHCSTPIKVGGGRLVLVLLTVIAYTEFVI